MIYGKEPHTYNERIGKVMSMVIRSLVFVIGILIVVIGVSQMAAANWWIDIMPKLMQPMNLQILGIIALVIGLILTTAALRHLVSLRPLVLVLGILMCLGGILLLANPCGAGETVRAMILSRPHEAQALMAQVGGLVRALIGVALIYAGSKRVGDA